MHMHIIHFFAFLISLQHYSVFLKQSMSRHQHISFAFLCLNGIYLMSARRRPAISSVCCLGRRQAAIGAPSAHCSNLTSAHHRIDGSPLSKNCLPTVVDFATPFIMLESSASCHTSYSFLQTVSVNQSRLEYASVCH